MKRLIALIISIAMVASLATGLAVTGFAENTGITINGNDIENKGYGINSLSTSVDGNTITIDKINYSSDTTIYIPVGKTLIVSQTSTEDAIYSGGGLTISGSGKLEVKPQVGHAIAANNNITISGGTVNATSNGYGKRAIYSVNGDITISSGTVTAIASGNNSYGIFASNKVEISGGTVIATASGTNSNGIYGSSAGVKISGGIITANATGSSLKGIGTQNGNVEITGGNVIVTVSGDNTKGIFASKYVTISGGTINATASGTNSYGIYANNNDVTISGGTVTASGTKSGIFASNKVEISSGTVTANGTENDSKGINANNDITISGGKVIATVSGTNASGIYGKTGVTITGGTITANVAGDYSIGIESSSSGGIYISGTNTKITIDAQGVQTVGIETFNDISISSDSYIRVNAGTAFTWGSGSYDIEIDGDSIDSEEEAKTYFYCENGSAITYENTYIYGSGWVVFGTAPNSEEDLDEEENDPEVELDLGNGPVTLKTSNNSVVFNDTKVFEVSIGDGDVFIPIDLSSAPKKIDGLFFNNEVYKYIDDSGKDIKIINRFAYAEVYTNKEVGNNPLSLHLTDVSEIAGTCATYLQKKAMNTSKVYAQVNYSFVSNGQPVENDAKIYVPVDGPAKVFYLFNAEKIGIVPCEVKDGYCVFDRYFDGTYVVCSAN